MPQKVRVFVSSTMEDLPNERQAVVQQISDLGLKSVNAEGLFPNGEGSWDLLADEISSSNIFVLILGNRYGWIPDIGPGGGSGKSVTHLEFEHARSCGLPILPFLQRLKYGADRESEDAQKRDAFRNEIGEWDKGQFRREFDLAADLGEAVRRALLDVFQDTFLKSEVKKTSTAKVNVANRAKITSNSPFMEMKEQELVLFAGAGFSVAAGYPTASTLAEVLGLRMGMTKTGSEILSRHTFADIATHAESKLGRACLVGVVRELLDTPIPVEPTSAHIQAVQTFRAILTTNYDLLFERACMAIDLPYKVILPSDRHQVEQGVLGIYKLDGSIDRPDSLALTRNDYEKAVHREGMWSSISSLLQAHGLVVAGHSLRGPTGQGVLARRDIGRPGYYVSPQLDELDTVTLARYNLEGIQATADHFMDALQENLEKKTR